MGEISLRCYRGAFNSITLEMYVFRDNNKPINVLTGIDYWLDNLICNVPELVMCFHVNGIVQVRWIQCDFLNLSQMKIGAGNTSPLF